MIYVSDHGEDMELTHTASPFQYNMVRIPLWIYLSPAYQHAIPRPSSSSVLMKTRCSPMICFLIPSPGFSKPHPISTTVNMI